MEIFAPLWDMVLQFWDVVMHLDVHLADLLARYGTGIYFILFAVIFCETGLVVTPFLPGDSLLFVAGALAATGGMDITTLVAVLWSAAVLGDNVNYLIGSYVGRRVFQWKDSRWFNRTAFDKAHAYYETHGGKTLVIARFLPIFRTFAPFVAGVAKMTYPKFLMFSVLGGTLWVGGLSYLGYWFGNLPIVKNNLTVVILTIIAISLMPLAIGYLKHRKAAQTPAE